MTENTPPAPVITHKSRGIPTVWLVPIVAALVGGWLAIKHFREAGIPIEISFQTASGIEAGKTKIKFKDVQVGIVDTVDIPTDASRVIVYATMDRPADRHLRENMKFWVVQPRIGPGGISGLGTIVSGAYIDIGLGDGGPATKFIGLEEPPFANSDVKGVRLVLKADELGSLSNGVPIFFRDVQVGHVEKTQLDDDGSGVQVNALVEAPYDKFVRTSSHFWNSSGVDVSLDAQGLSVRTEGLASLLSGGLAFDSPEEGEPAKDGDVFQLYAGFREAMQRTHPEAGLIYVFYPPGPTRGLDIGAPVALEGVVIGEVIDVKMEYSPEFGIRTPVRIHIEPANVQGVDPDDIPAVSGMIDDLVERGLRAQLQAGSLLTGKLFVDLEFHPEVPVELLGSGDLPELPAAPSALQTLEKKVEQFVDNLASMPLEGLVSDAQAAVDSLRDLIVKVETKVDPLIDGVDGMTAEAQKTAEALRELIAKVDGKVDPLVNDVDVLTAEAQKTLAAATEAIESLEGIGAGFAPDSTMYYDMATALEELAAAARSIRILTAFLERNPSALIRGKK